MTKHSTVLFRFGFIQWHQGRAGGHDADVVARVGGAGDGEYDEPRLDIDGYVPRGLRAPAVSCSYNG